MKNFINKFKVPSISLLLLVTTYICYSQDFIKLYYINNIKNQMDFYADNASLCPFQIKVRVRLYTNVNIELRSSTNLPFYTILKPEEKGCFLFSIKLSANLTNLLRYGFDSYMGDPANVSNDDSCLYLFPYQEGEEYKVNQGYNTRYSHRGWTKYSIDFGMNSGTPVCAARDGLVVDVKTNSNKGGISRRYAAYANYITIYHIDGTFAQYVHLLKNGSMVNIGDNVKAGQIIGFSGSTGRSSGPHLHFMVYKPTFLGMETIPTKFLGLSGEPLVISPKKYFISYHKIINTNNSILSNGNIASKENTSLNTAETNVGGP